MNFIQPRSGFVPDSPVCSEAERWVECIFDFSAPERAVFAATSIQNSAPEGHKNRMCYLSQHSVRFATTYWAIGYIVPPAHRNRWLEYSSHDEGVASLPIIAKRNDRRLAMTVGLQMRVLQTTYQNSLSLREALFIA